MTEHLNFIHAIIFVPLAVYHVYIWVRRGFWLPKYVHVLAGIAFLLAFGTFGLIQYLGWGRAGTAGTKPNEFLVALIFPVIVYAAFVLYGGSMLAPEAVKVRQLDESPLQQRSPFEEG